MEEQLINFETAKLAKEKGFEMKCLHFYTKPNSKMFGIDEKERPYPIKNISKNLYECGQHATLNAKNVFSAPTQSLLQKWIRKIHAINITINHEVHMKWFYDYSDIALSPDTYDDPDYIHESEEGFNSYEEALEAGLFAILKLLK